MTLSRFISHRQRTETDCGTKSNWTILETKNHTIKVNGKYRANEMKRTTAIAHTHTDTHGQIYRICTNTHNGDLLLEIALLLLLFVNFFLLSVIC